MSVRPDNFRKHPEYQTRLMEGVNKAQTPGNSKPLILLEGPSAEIQLQKSYGKYSKVFIAENPREKYHPHVPFCGFPEDKCTKYLVKVCFIHTSDEDIYSDNAEIYDVFSVLPSGSS